MTRNSGNVAGIKVEGVEAKRNDAALAAAAASIAAQQPEEVLVIGTPKYMADAITQLRKAGIRSPLFALSYLPPPLLLMWATAKPMRAGSRYRRHFPIRTGAFCRCNASFRPP